MPVSITEETLTPSLVEQRIVRTLPDIMQEGASGVYLLELEVEGGGTFQSTWITAMTLTLYDEETGSLINNRLNQDILGGGSGDNDVQVGMTGEITWAIQPEDNVYVDPTKTKRLEVHRAIFRVSYNAGSDDEVFVHEMRFQVKPLYVPIGTN